MTAKVTISLPDELLARLDAEAGDLGMARSELVQESLAAYLGKTAEERHAEARQRRMLWALEGMRTFAEDRTVIDDRPTLEILRKIRETDDSAPLRGHGDDEK
ncbi:MAG: CopG family transcriptional regulator [Aeromicrobium sp.]|jgi:metal-responsive CopG/Arc/MetJ family transcriptional regulator|nr:CopG family transcriptional regulator [Aeromicrobium sp.]